jgi:uncharacterized membrane protein YiaA
MVTFLEALKNPSEQTLIETQIAFYLGIIIGLIGAWIAIFFFSDWKWYLKLLVTISDIGILGLQYIALRGLFIQRKQYIEMRKMAEGLIRGGQL